MFDCAIKTPSELKPQVVTFDPGLKAEARKSSIVKRNRSLSLLGARTPSSATVKCQTAWISIEVYVLLNPSDDASPLAFIKPCEDFANSSIPFMLHSECSPQLPIYGRIRQLTARLQRRHHSKRIKRLVRDYYCGAHKNDPRRIGQMAHTRNSAPAGCVATPENISTRERSAKDD